MALAGPARRVGPCGRAAGPALGRRSRPRRRSRRPAPTPVASRPSCVPCVRAGAFVSGIRAWELGSLGADLGVLVRRGALPFHHPCRTRRKHMPAPSLDGLGFAPLDRPEHGEVDASTFFTYHEADGVVWAEYSGGDIVRGHLVGTRTGTPWTSATPSSTGPAPPLPGTVSVPSWCCRTVGSGWRRRGLESREGSGTSAVSRSRARGPDTRSVVGRGIYLESQRTSRPKGWAMGFNGDIVVLRARGPVAGPGAPRRWKRTSGLRRVVPMRTAGALCTCATSRIRTPSRTLADRSGRPDRLARAGLRGGRERCRARPGAERTDFWEGCSIRAAPPRSCRRPVEQDRQLGDFARFRDEAAAWLEEDRPRVAEAAVRWAAAAGYRVRAEPIMELLSLERDPFVQHLFFRSAHVPRLVSISER